MRVAHDTDSVSVFDEVLAPEELRSLESWVEQITYQGVHHERWRTVWRLGEGEPLRGPTWTTSASGSTGSQIPPALQPLAATLREVLLKGRNEHEELSLTPWIYPRGTGLGLHRDNGRFDGSYVFYLVQEWDVHWGGLLNCIIDDADAIEPRRAVLDPRTERSSVASVGHGMWIAPARNRLVTLGAEVPHFISRVDYNAGDRARVSIAGFVHRAK